MQEQPYPYRCPQYSHLLMSGGGLSGITYLGVYRFLKQYNMFDKIRTIYGVSMGAMFAFLFGFDIGCDKAEDIFLGKNSLLEREDVCSYSSKEMLHILQKKGAFSTKRIRMVAEIVLEQLYGIKDITFAEYLKRTGRDIHICATCVNTQTVEDFCNEFHPNMSVLTALEASACIPLIFQPVQYQGNLYIDGGCSYNLPLHLISMVPANKVLAINLGEDIQNTTEDLMKNMFGYIWSILHGMIENNTRLNILQHEEQFDILDMINIPIPMVATRCEKDKIMIDCPKETIETGIMFGYQEMVDFFKRRGYFSRSP